MPNYQLVLSSTSPFRQELLKKLTLPFITAKPDCDETPYPNESAAELVQRLAKTKAQSCHLDQASLVIGSDQVCVVNQRIIGKPHTAEQAVEQLLSQSGQCITFYTGLAVYNNQTKQCDVVLDTFNVYFRELTRDMAENYVHKEHPLHCAGSFKCEGLGITLFERLEGNDPNSLIGLPLIHLTRLLEAHGMRAI
ncbi:Maf family protein [Vibrio palustris]|uniref:7-methyl-GTP pyrophosphatase n=1 Tax=Vibrio palustris TaxID=1918946 RepID=A0A1R4B0M7_9VIBR|nr:nucleoside triphosphate pyrophosphatase [Vibrio palustris]SJL82461.1 Maf-like protein YceF [Vibrio palustris]